MVTFDHARRPRDAQRDAEDPRATPPRAYDPLGLEFTDEPVGAATAGYVQAMSRLDRITTDPAVCHGQPTVRGLRYPIATLLELLASGMTIDDVLDDYPDLERDDLFVALEYGALTAGGGRTVPLGAS